MAKSCKTCITGSPPDGGWSWVVLFASFMNTVISDGIAYTSGVFLPDYMEYFGSDKGTTSWAAAVLTGVYLTIGPVVSALVTLYGCRVVSATGAIIYSGSLFLSAFCPNVETLTFVYGVLGGIGMGMIYTPTILAVNFYFHKRRALATGIAICGSGIGIFVFAPLREYLLKLYGWKGATWILSGLALNCIALSLVYRPINHKEYPEEQFGSSHVFEKENKQIDGQEMIVIHNNTLEVPTLYPSGGKNSAQISAKNLEASDKLLSPSGGGNSYQRHTTGQKDFVEDMSSSVSRDIYANSQQLWGSAVLTTFGSISNFPKTGKYAGRWGRFVATMIALKNETFNMHIMKMPTVIIFAAGRFILGLGFFVPVIFLPTMAQGLAISRSESAMLLSIVGIGSTIGRIAAGFFGDKPWANSIVLFSAASILIGICSIILPFFHQYILIAIYCAIFGCLSGAVVSWGPSTCIQLSGVEYLSPTFGILTMCDGIAAFIGAPIAGTIADRSGSFDASFYFAGITMVVGGIVGSVPCRTSKNHISTPKVKYIKEKDDEK